LRGHILISHTHWDHIQGVPFFEPLFVPGNEWDIYGPKGSRAKASERPAGQFQAMTPIEPALAERSVLLGIADPSMAAALSEAIHAEGIRATFFSGIDEARDLIAKDRPSPPAGDDHHARRTAIRADQAKVTARRITSIPF
jgi:ribonuclease BN (tRNA processing enzyme)